jgi:N-acetylglucosaminyldiphosphoundecaprenol N-acetyl-beta-D-mannosaminyltransferase
MRNYSSPCAYLKQASLLGVKIDNLTLEELLSAMQTLISQDHKSIISYVNIHAVNIAYSIPWFKRFLNQSDLVFCDGNGVKLAAKLTGQYLHSRYTPPDFMEHICEMAVHYSWRIFFLGAKPGIAERAADRLISKFPGLQIHSHHGYFDKIRESAENQSVVKQINEFCPQILALGFGMPLQEKWIEENLGSLNIKLAFPAGALFDYLSGNLPRGPRWATDHGLEWLSRLLIEPRRLWKRYLIGNPLFFWRIFFHHFLGYPLPK